MKEMFIDSSALYAWADRSSEEGDRIKSFILENKRPLVTTNLVIAETLSLITKRAGKAHGIKFGKHIFESSFLKIVYLGEKIEQEAWEMYKKYKDKDFDLIDATSFVLCQKRGIDDVITLDHHFSQMKFQIHP